MAKKSMVYRDIHRAERVQKALLLGKKPPFKNRIRNRCALCGRDSGYMRYFDMCRICVRENAAKGLIPGLRKSSW